MATGTTATTTTRICSRTKAAGTDPEEIQRCATTVFAAHLSGGPLCLLLERRYLAGSQTSDLWPPSTIAATTCATRSSTRRTRWKSPRTQGMPWKLLGCPPCSLGSCVVAAALRLCCLQARSAGTLRGRPCLGCTVGRKPQWFCRTSMAKGRRARSCKDELLVRSRAHSLLSCGLIAQTRESTCLRSDSWTGKGVLAMSCASLAFGLAGVGQVQGPVVCAVVQSLLLSLV
mmetsp:Transcript_47565/g.116623  ORF Transcript_47565/g.116623 Transcript_47565/m.116623 type:complete len:230 (+) Transcript_47565:256-945(+)